MLRVVGAGWNPDHVIQHTRGFVIVQPIKVVSQVALSDLELTLAQKHNQRQSLGSFDDELARAGART